MDCPGHASLIRTIIGGAQIIDLMVLVVDVTKGIQTQTAECIVIGEVATSDMVVALNKTGGWTGGRAGQLAGGADGCTWDTAGGWEETRTGGLDCLID